MGDTTGNQGLAIATNGTSHVATTQGCSDVCKLSNNTPVGFPNYIAVRGNLVHGTTNTLIQNQPVWIERSHLGPTSNPAHAGINKGVTSQTYRGIAKATNWSKDVKKEGQFVVRTNDPTQQNGGPPFNTVGQVVGSNLTLAFKKDDAYKKLFCYVASISGVCSHGRALGPPPGARPGAEANYLEVLAGDTVDLTCQHVSLVGNALEPRCFRGIHPSWRVVRSAEFEQPKVEEHRSKTLVKLGRSMLGRPTRLSDYGYEANPNPATGKVDRADQELATTARCATEFVLAALWFDAQKYPPVVDVEAFGCAGSKKVTVKVFPDGKAEFDLFGEEVQKAVEWILKVGEIVSKLGKFWGFSIELELFQSPTLKFSIQYKELTKSTPEKRRFGLVLPACYPVQARRNWQLEFSFDPLVGVTFEANVPIATALGPVGAAGARILAKVGVALDLFFKVEFSLTPKASIAWDEYDEIVADGSADIELTFSAGVKLTAPRLEVTVAGYCKCTLQLVQWRPKPIGMLACRAQGEVQLGVKATATVDAWLFKADYEFNWAPDDLKKEFPPGREFTIIPWLGVPVVV